MLKAVSAVLALAASLVVVGSLWAADEPSGPKDKPPMHHPQFSPIDRMLRGITLTDAQKAKVEELKKEYAPKFKEAFGRPGDILTEEQKKVRDEAVKAAKDAGKSEQEVWEAGRKAVKLTDEQKKKMAEIRGEKGRKAMMALDKEVRDKLLSLLTPEQKKLFKKNNMPQKHRRGPPEGGQGPEGGPPPGGGPGPEGGHGPEGGPPPEGGPGHEGGPPPGHEPDIN
jgi:Spy/CpxP family protein refolding chaperone